MAHHNTIKVGISHGDINGIGYEVIMKTLLDPRILEMCIPIVYGSPKVAAYHRKALNINTLSFNHIRNFHFYRTNTEAKALVEPIKPDSDSVTILNCFTPILVGLNSKSNRPSTNEVVAKLIFPSSKITLTPATLG